MLQYSLKIFVIFFAFGFVLYAQVQPSKKIAILPFSSNGLDEVSIQTAESILRLEISRQSSMDIVSEKRTKESLQDSDCSNVDCALEFGKKLDVTRVAGVNLSMLGEKIIIQYFLVDTDSGDVILIDRITASYIEELDVVMKRIASSIVNVKLVAENAQVGMIIDEESKESLRRTSNKNFGVSFGYLYPQDGYNGQDRSFVFEGRFDYELEDYAVGLMMGIRNGFAMNIYSDYLFSKTDFCPYLGGAFGFHWVANHGTEYYYDNVGVYRNHDKKADGFELTLNGGMRILHTYNFQIIVNVDFIITFNDFHDKAIVFTIGIL